MARTPGHGVPTASPSPPVEPAEIRRQSRRKISPENRTRDLAHRKPLAVTAEWGQNFDYFQITSSAVQWGRRTHARTHVISPVVVRRVVGLRYFLFLLSTSSYGGRGGDSSSVPGAATTVVGAAGITDALLSHERIHVVRLGTAADPLPARAQPRPLPPRRQTHLGPLPPRPPRRRLRCTVAIVRPF